MGGTKKQELATVTDNSNQEVIYQRKREKAVVEKMNRNEGYDGTEGDAKLGNENLQQILLQKNTLPLLRRKDPTPKPSKIEGS